MRLHDVVGNSRMPFNRGSMLESIYRAIPIPVQNLLLSMEGRRKNRLRFRREFQERLAILERLERASIEEVRDWQMRQLDSLIYHAHASIAFYRKRFERSGVKPENVRTLSDLRRIPILTREQVHSHFNQLHAPRELSNKVRLGHTSGTTGSPLGFYWDREVEWWNTVVYTRHRDWLGVRRGERYASILGRMVVPRRQARPPYWRLNRASNQLIFSAFHLHEANLPEYVTALRDFRPVMLEAYPSTAFVLARFLVASGEQIPLRAVHCSSETLLPLQRETIEKAFDCSVFDYYGCAERVIAAGECEEHNGLHVFEPYGITEILDADGEPCPPGVHGRLVLTGLHNRLMPLIRYEIGDTSAFVAGDCPCGRSWRRIDPITTKAEDIVVTPDGRFISSSVLTHPFKPMDNIAASQIVQESPDRIVVRIVRRPGYTDDDSKKLLGGLQARVGGDIAIDLEFVDEIPRGKSGKFRWVVSNVPLEFKGQTVDNLYGSERRS